MAGMGAAPAFTADAVPLAFSRAWRRSGSAFGRQLCGRPAADGSLCTILVDGTHQKVFGIDLPSSATVLLPVHFHPGWTANLRGETLAIGPSAANGLIELALPEGKNTVTLSWGGTQLENGAQLVTLCSLVAMLGLSGYSAWRQRK